MMNGWSYIRLIDALRKAGLPISPQDFAEALTCLERFPELSAEIILKTSLIHRPHDRLIFQTIWQILFSADFSETVGSSLPLMLENGQSTFGSGGQEIGQGSGGISRKSNNLPALLPLPAFETATKGLPDVPSDLVFEEMVKKMLSEINYYGWINAVDLALQRGELTEEQWQAFQDEGSALQDLVRQELVKGQMLTENNWQPLQRLYWKHKPLQSLTDAEKTLVQAALRQWARKLAVHPGLRWRKSSRGVLDLRQTVQGAFHGDGKVFRLRYHRRVPRVPELVVLCDVSNSVAPYAEFLLFLVGRLRTRFRKVRLFFFIDTLWDVSGQIWDEDLGELQEEIESWGRKASSGFSDYGQVFQDFTRDVLSEVSSKATLLIMGDGKNNYRPPRSEYLAQISEQVRQVYWLNPLNVEEWSERDNVISSYQPYCTKIYRCRTVEDLQKIARRLF